MSAAPQPAPDRTGMANWAVDILRSLTIQNVLTLGMLAVIAVPSYFAWRFMTDGDFRHEFMSTSKIVDMGVPCLVVIGSQQGQSERYTVAVSYAVVNRLEYLVAARSPGLLSNAEVQKVCGLVHDDGDLMEAAVRAREHNTRPPEP